MIKTKGQFCTFACAGMLMVASQVQATTYTAEFDAAKDDPASITGVYDPRGNALVKIFARYDDMSDLFSFRYDFWAAPGVLLGDAFFKFSRDGELPSIDNGTLGVPRYLIDAQSGKAQVSSYDREVHVLIDARFELDTTTGLGFVAFEHDVSDMRDIFEAAGKNVDPVQWDGGSFTSDFAIWSHIVRDTYFDYDVGAGQIVNGTLDGSNWIAFDPDITPFDVMVDDSVPLPASGLALITGLLAFAGLRKRKI